MVSTFDFTIKSCRIKRINSVKDLSKEKIKFSFIIEYFVNDGVNKTMTELIMYKGNSSFGKKLLDRIKQKGYFDISGAIIPYTFQNTMNGKITVRYYFYVNDVRKLPVYKEFK